jgi:hypothetical protein
VIELGEAMLPIGTFETCRPALRMSEVGGRPEAPMFKTALLTDAVEKSKIEREST